MPQPILLEVQPSNLSTGYPTGESITLSFDRGIDLLTAERYIVLYGRDFDQTSGPEGVLYIDKDTGDNPYFLRSPGFAGVVNLDITAVYYDLDSGEDIEGLVFTSETEEAAYLTAGVGHRLYIRPTEGVLAGDLSYTLHVIGDVNTNKTGIASRTVYDVVADVGNATSTGEVFSAGSYTGLVNDTVNIQITLGGDIGTAKYKWWLTSEGVGTAKYDKLSNRKIRTLIHGIQIRFTGEGFTAGDLYTFNVEPPQFLATSTKITFTTNDGSYTQAPDSPSLPATSTPPSSTIPSTPGASTEQEALQIISMLPPDGAYNVNLDTREIVITFNDLLRANTITPDSVRVFKLPALGWYQGQTGPKELQKRLTVNGETLVISF